jgi:excisionase family DNA binding protein
MMDHMRHNPAPSTQPDKPVAVDYVRVSRVAEELDISRSSVYDLIRNGELRGVIRLGSRLRIPRTSVDELVKRGMVS